MSVESWDPSISTLTPRHRAILMQLTEQLPLERLELNDDDRSFLRPAMHLDAAAWESFVSSESDATVIAWSKVLTLIERDFNGFELGSSSPVLAMIKVIKQRDILPVELFSWIKAHTRNRFLPYGNLADRLSRQ